MLVFSEVARHGGRQIGREAAEPSSTPSAAIDGAAPSGGMLPGPFSAATDRKT